MSIPFTKWSQLKLGLAQVNVRYGILGKSLMISHCALVLSHQDPKCIIETMKIFHRDLLRVLLFLLYVTPSTIAPHVREVASRE